MTSPSPEQLAEWERLAGEATPGEWATFDDGYDWHVYVDEGQRVGPRGPSNYIEIAECKQWRRAVTELRDTTRKD